MHFICTYTGTRKFYLVWLCVFFGKPYIRPKHRICPYELKRHIWKQQRTITLYYPRRLCTLTSCLLINVNFHYYSSNQLSIFGCLPLPLYFSSEWERKCGWYTVDIIMRKIDICNLEFSTGTKDTDGSRGTSAETISAEAGNFFSIEEPVPKYSLLAIAKIVLSDCWANHGISHYLTYVKC